MSLELLFRLVGLEVVVIFFFSLSKEIFKNF